MAACMQTPPNAVLSRIRTPAQALTDLVAKHRRMVLNDPRRPLLTRMIGQLETEIVLRGGMVVYAGGDVFGVTGSLSRDLILGWC
jgi:hypothetical protein